MIIPKSIKVANHTISIAEMEREMADIKGVYGEFDQMLLEIKICTDFPRSHIRETLMHELMHAIFWCFDIQDQDGEERTVTKMAIGMDTVLMDNPNLRAFLLDGAY